MQSDHFLRTEVEPYIDNLYRQSPLLYRHRDTAIVHLLRVFSDAVRFSTIQSILSNDDVQFFLKLRKAQEGLPWAMRWVWSDCPIAGVGSLELNWDAYEEGARLLELAFNYYHLYRCFVLYSRNIFGIEVKPGDKYVRFFFNSESEERRDAAGSLYTMQRDVPKMPGLLDAFLRENMPVIRVILAEYINKIDDSSVRYTVPSEIFDLFMRWATLQTRYMRFNLPGTWKFGEFNLHQFRSFWKSLLSMTLVHSVVHELADRSVATRGGAVGSIVIQLGEQEFVKMSKMFPVRLESFRAIFELLIYNPTRKYWDPIWQPLFRISDGTILISPQLVATSSAERNLMILMGRNADWRKYYNQVSAEKEGQQLSELADLFSADRYIIRKRVRIPRNDGSTLSDIDLFVFDRVDRFLLLVHAKWLIRPDFVSETLTKDKEIENAIAIAKMSSERIDELGAEWLHEVLNTEITSEHIECGPLIVNRDFIPSGWVYDEQIPVVDMEYFQNARNATFRQGLKMLHDRCKQIQVWLEGRYPTKLGSNEMKFGEYTFDLPTFDLG